MANYANLISAIQNVVKTNGNEEITGALLQQSLLAMISSLGAGYQFMGVAEPTTNPGTPDQNVFYIAYKGGTYSNFNSAVIGSDGGILKYNGSWSFTSFGDLKALYLNTFGDVVDFSQFELVNYVINNSTGNWQITASGTTRRCYIIPVSNKKGRRLFVKTNDTNNSRIAFLTSDSHVNNTAASFCSGYGGTIRLRPGGIVDIIIPNDCEYLYVGVQSGSTDIAVKNVWFDGETETALINFVRYCNVLAGQYINGTTHVTTSSNAFTVYTIKPYGAKKLNIKVGASDAGALSYAFYSTETISADGYISGLTSANNLTLADVEIPAECKLIAVTNRASVCPDPEIRLGLDSIFGVYDEQFDKIKDGQTIKSDGTVVGTKQLRAYINYSTGAEGSSGDYFEIWKIRNNAYNHVKCHVGLSDSVAAAIAFYSTETITTDGYLQEYSLQGTNTGTSGRTYQADVPANCKLIVITNRNGYVAEPTIELTSTIADTVTNVIDIINSFSGQLGDISDNKKKANNLFRAPWVFGMKNYGHLFIEKINSITQANNAVVPCQSLFDVDITARLGFKYIEANVQETQDGVLIPIHGDGGAFGNEVYDAVNETDIRAVQISSVTYDWIKTNVRYRSKYAKYQTTIPTLDEFLAECKSHGISVMMTYSVKAYNLAKKYFGDDWIAYNGNRNAGFTGIIMQYSNLTTVDAILAECDSKKPPYIHMLNTTAANVFLNSGLADLAKAVHEKDCMLGLAGCYRTAAENVKFFEDGGDVSASGWMVDEFVDGNLLCINSGIDFSKFAITDGSVSGGILTLAQNGTIKAGNELSQIFFGKGGLRIRFEGTIKVVIFGHGSNVDCELSSDGMRSIFISSYFSEQVPKFEILAMAQTKIFEITYNASVV